MCGPNHSKNLWILTLQGVNEQTQLQTSGEHGKMAWLGCLLVARLEVIGEVVVRGSWTGGQERLKHGNMRVCRSLQQIDLTGLERPHRERNVGIRGKDGDKSIFHCEAWNRTCCPSSDSESDQLHHLD